ncbi:MAG: 50S ribosomal protein L23 [Tissierellia bacterium]|jgi:large subunit ribosomal protein L23|nr:50S ribosomal protein L23 [Bacillota bacterium]NLL23379.1 50S ribosomal protein L23 [Tissierellia bacterium]
MSAYDIILAPVITENTAMLAEERKYTFRVDFRANKYQIKDAVESIFGVQVEKVNTMHVRGKLKRQGRNVGYTSKWKKAVITLKPESKTIDFFEGI